MKFYPKTESAPPNQKKADKKQKIWYKLYVKEYKHLKEERMAAKKRKANPAFMKPVRPDKALGVVIGTKPLPRTQVTKKIWAYIKRNRLQDKKKRIMINADAKLKPVFGGKKQVNMFQMTKLISRHLK